MRAPEPTPVPTPLSTGDRQLTGMAWVAGSALSFSIAVTLVKFLGAGYPSAMQAFIRQAVGVVILLPLIARAPVEVFRTRHPWVLLSRGAATSVSMILSYYAYQKMPLAEANALSFTRTLWLVPLAVLLLGEKVGLVRLATTLLGFVGVVVILRIGDVHSLLGLPALLGLTAALLVAFSVTGMKAMSRDHSALSLLAWSAVLGFVFTLPPALLVWRMPTLPDLLLLIAMGVVGVVTQFMYIRGMALGDATAIAPVDYIRIVFTAISGYLLFGEVPAWTTWAGAVIIISSTAYLTLHSRWIALRNEAETVVGG